MSHYCLLCLVPLGRVDRYIYRCPVCLMDVDTFVFAEDINEIPGTHECNDPACDTKTTHLIYCRSAHVVDHERHPRFRYGNTCFDCKIHL